MQRKAEYKNQNYYIIYKHENVLLSITLCKYLSILHVCTLDSFISVHVHFAYAVKFVKSK